MKAKRRAARSCSRAAVGLLLTLLTACGSAAAPPQRAAAALPAAGLWTLTYSGDCQSREAETVRITRLDAEQREALPAALAERIDYEALSRTGGPAPLGAVAARPWGSAGKLRTGNAPSARFRLALRLAGAETRAGADAIQPGAPACGGIHAPAHAPR